jgi:epoxide hydrolase 4
MIEQFQQPLPHGITLSCRAAGERGRPVLMFLHGFPEAAFVWDELLAHFSRAENGGYRCVAPNLRGFERSSTPADVKAYRPKHLVADIEALIASETAGAPLACLVAHDWGGAVAWNLANQQPQLLERLAIINSPHPGTFLRELRNSTKQQQSSAYMNFLIRPDAEKLLAENDYRRLWGFFGSWGGADWLTDAVKQQYRDVWDGPAGGPPGAGLTGGCNYYRASPLRPPRPEDPAAAAVALAPETLRVELPTLVLWGMQDVALPPELIEGLEEYVPQLRLEKVEGASHWIVHEQPAFVAERLAAFLGQ